MELCRKSAPVDLAFLVGCVFAERRMHLFAVEVGAGPPRAVLIFIWQCKGCYAVTFMYF